MDVYVLIDKKTGKFWQKVSRNGRRGVYAFTSYAKAEATISMFHPQPNKNEIEIKRYEATEHNP